MKLLGTNTSPYVRKVRLVLLEKNISHTYLIDPPREPGSQVARVNPLGRIPALIPHRRDQDYNSCTYHPLPPRITLPTIVKCTPK